MRDSENAALVQDILRDYPNQDVSLFRTCSKYELMFSVINGKKDHPQIKKKERRNQRRTHFTDSCFDTSSENIPSRQNRPS